MLPTEETIPRLLRITPDGNQQSFAVPDGAPFGVAEAADGSIWATEPTAHAVLRLTLSSTPPNVRRRATLPPYDRVLPHCATGVVANVLSSDPLGDLLLSNDRVFVSDQSGTIASVPKDGGIWTLHGQVRNSVVGSMTADGSNIYFFAAPQESSIATVYSMPKSGGAATTIANAVQNPSTIVADGDYLYVVSIGPPLEEGYLADGAVIRLRKNGSETVKLASGLSTPFALAVSGEDVFSARPGPHAVTAARACGACPRPALQ